MFDRGDATRTTAGRSIRPGGWRLVLGLLALLLCPGVAVAGGSKGKKARVETFRGSCDFAGTVSFSPPLTGTSRPTHAVAELRGGCTGTLTKANGRTRNLDGAPVRYHAESDGTQSCAASSASGGGYFDFGRSRIGFTLTEARVGAVAPLDLQGRAGGSFGGTATASGDPVAIAVACAGQGLAQTDIQISGATTPQISG